jgi:hypothetical protein
MPRIAKEVEENPWVGVIKLSDTISNLTDIISFPSKKKTDYRKPNTQFLCTPPFAFRLCGACQFAERIEHILSIPEFKGGVMKNNERFSNSQRGSLNPYDMKIDQRGLNPHIVIWESELRFMAGLAARWGCVETGGEKYGLTSHAGRPVIMLATPPGPNSIHGVANFRQDIDFLENVNGFLRKNFGLLYGGNFHSHHILGIIRPSHVDIQSINSIAQRNGFRRLGQFILTFQKKPCTDLHRINGRPPARSRMHWAGESEAAGRFLSKIYPGVKARLRTSRQIIFIRIHSYLYPDAAHGGPVRCPIRIIPGTSPFRRAVMKNSLIPELAQPYSFPMSRILFDSVTLPEPTQHVLELPEWISRQCFELPEDVRKNIGLVIKEGLVIFSLPLPWAERTVFVAFTQKPPHELQGIFLGQTGKEAAPIEISLEALCCGPYTAELARIYKGIVRLLKGKGLAEPAEKSIRKGEIVNPEEERAGEQGAAYAEKNKGN